MLPWKSLIPVQKNSELSVYLQIANSIINAIKSGVVQPGSRIPGTRELSQLLKVHRKTLTNAYDELSAQGWIKTEVSKGTFINDNLHEISPRKFKDGVQVFHILEKTGYDFKINTNLRDAVHPHREIIGFHDGPDTRLLPVEALARAYRGIITRKWGRHHFSYVEGFGNPLLRKIFSDLLNDTRGMHTCEENILITRGSQLGLFMIIDTLISKGENVIVGDTSYYYTDRIFMQAGANLLRTEVDDSGINIDHIEKHCRKRKVRAVYVTPHHHYPTTVTLAAPRRMKLLSLAEKYGFIILEDDYDYDFHFQSSPILPLASADKSGMVVYIGTLSKTFAPAIRLGYIAAPKNLIKELTKFRQLLDVQGDPILEQAIAELYQLGEMRRHMKKVLKEYKLRRDFMCEMLKDKLSDVIDFKVPDGGLAIWAKFDKKIPLPDLSEKMRKKEIILPSGLVHDIGKRMNCTRLGFGWMNMNETEKAVDAMNDIVRNDFKFKANG